MEIEEEEKYIPLVKEVIEKMFLDGFSPEEVYGFFGLLKELVIEVAEGMELDITEAMNLYRAGI